MSLNIQELDWGATGRHAPVFLIVLIQKRHLQHESRYYSSPLSKATTPVVRLAPSATLTLVVWPLL